MQFMRTVLATLLCLLGTTTVNTTAAADDKAGCTCKYQGGDVKQGETACIKTANGNSLARCEMVLNNTSWTVLNKPCEVEQSLKMSPTPEIGKNQSLQLAIATKG
jgi:hypothetical protein